MSVALVDIIRKRHGGDDRLAHDHQRDRLGHVFMPEHQYDQREGAAAIVIQIAEKAPAETGGP